MLERFDQLVGFALAGEAGLQQAIAAFRSIRVETDIGRDRHVRLAGSYGRGD